MADDKLTFDDIRDWVLACYAEAEEGRRDYENLYTQAWDSYFNKHNFSLKQDWQSKTPVPSFAMAVDQAAGAVKQALKKSTRMFSVEVLNPSNPYLVALAKFLHDVMHELMRQAKAPVVLGDGVKTNLITNLQVHKCMVRKSDVERLAPRFVDRAVGTLADGSPQTEPELTTESVVETQTRLDLSVINPKAIYLDPRGRNLYRIHRTTKDRAFLSEPGVRKLYRPIAVDHVLSNDMQTTTEEEQERFDLDIYNAHNAFRHQVEILEYWGPVYNRRGEQVLKNRWITLFNRQYVALMEPYPFWHGQDPFVVGNLNRVPFSPYGKLLYQHVGPIGVAITEMLCMLLDAAKFGTLNAFGIDTSLVEDVEDLANGIFPGMTLNMTGPNAIQQLNFKGVDLGAFQMLGQLLQFFQNYSGVTEFLSGTASVRGRATATETEYKTAQSNNFFEAMTGDLEDFVFEPLLEKTYWNIVQFFEDWNQPELQAIAMKHGVAPEMLGRSPVERYKILKGTFRFHAVGLSAVLRRAEMLEKILRLLEVLGNRPEFLQMTNAPKLYEKILEAFEFEDLIMQGNQIPPVVAQAALAPGDFQAVPGSQQFVAPPAEAPGMGALLKSGRGPQ